MDENLEDTAPIRGESHAGDSQAYARALFALLNTVLADSAAETGADNDLTEEEAYLLSVEVREQLREIARSIAQISIVLR